MGRRRESWVGEVRELKEMGLEEDGKTEGILGRGGARTDGELRAWRKMTVTTVSEQERNGQGRRDVGKSVHVRPTICSLSRDTRVRAENGKQSGLQ